MDLSTSQTLHKNAQSIQGAECHIDKRNFRTNKEFLHHLKTCRKKKHHNNK